jgi:hypothetical protein
MIINPYTFAIAPPTPGGDDMYWNNVSALLHFDGANGSTTFTDQTGKVWARRGSVTSIGTTQSVFGSSSLYIGPTNLTTTGDSGITTPDHDDWDFGLSDFEIEWYVYFLNLTSYQTIFDHGGAAGGGIVIQTDTGNGRIAVYLGSPIATIIEGSNPTINAWHAYKLARYGNTLVLRRDGVITAISINGAIGSANIVNTKPAIIGASWSGTSTGQYNVAGYIDEFRATKLVAREYEVQLLPFGNQQLAGMVWLNPDDVGPTVGISRGNKKLIPVSGSVYALARSNLSRNTGKYYFEGALIAAGASKFGLIGLAKASTPVTNYPGSDANSWGYYEQDGKKYHSATGTTFGAAYVAGDLIGCAVDLDSGKLWWSLNGVWIASGDPAAGTNPAFTGVTGDLFPAVALSNSNASTWGTMFSLDDQVYAPPSGFSCWDPAPSPTFQFVKALLKFDGNFTDVLGTVWMPAAGATTTTSSPKIGSGCLSLNGTSTGYVASAANSNFAFGTGDFTIEFWVKGTVDPAGKYLFDKGAGNICAISFTPAGRLAYFDTSLGTGNANYTLGPTTGAVFNGIWHHVAVSRKDGVVRGFFDGVRWFEVIGTLNDTSNTIWLGRYGGGTTLNVTGFMDELRVTNGLARYIDNFVPRKIAFPQPSSNRLTTPGGNVLTTPGGNILRTTI